MTKSVGAGIDAERASGGSMTRPMHSADSDPSNTDSVIDDLGSYLDSLPDPAIAVGQDGLIVDSNSLFLDLSGYGIDQIRHLSVESLVPGELRGAHRTYRSELPSSVRQRRMGSTLDLKLQRKNGSLCPVDISLSMVRFRGKRISIATARDMTERRVALAKEISSAADLLSDMGRIVGESRSLKDLYRTVSEVIHKVVPADRVSIVSHSASDSFYQVESATGTQLDGIAAGDRLAISGTLVGSVIATGEPILGLGEPLEELRSRYPGLSDQFGTRFKTFACVPLKTADSIVGALFISAHDAHAFSRTDIENVMLMAPQLAGAISVLRQSIAASTARDDALVVSEIARAAGETLDLAKLFDLVRLKITAHIPYDRFTVLHFDAARDVWILGYQYGLNPGRTRIGAALPISERTGIEFKNLEGPRILSTSDVQELQGHEPLWQQALAAGIRSALRLPVRWDGRVITVINLLSKKPDAYDLRHAALGDRIASHIAGPIANAELHAATASLANEVGLLAEIGRFAGDLRDLDSALDSVFDLSQRLLPASRAAVSIIDSETQRIDTIARIGRRLPKAGQIQIDDGIKSVIQDVMKSGEPRVIDNAMIQSASNDSELAKAYRDLGFQSILIVPLIAHGSPIGFITWWSEKDCVFDGNGVRLGERIAAQLAGPIANWDATRKLKSVAVERQLIADVGTAFSKYPEFQDAFDVSVKLLAEHFPITRVFVSQVNQTSGTATIISLFGLESDDTQVGIEYPLTGSHHELALEGSGVLLIDDSNLEALSSNVPRLIQDIKNGLVSHVTVPLISEGTVIGTLGIRSGAHNAYSDQDGAVMARIGAIVSGALAKSLLSEKIKRQGDELRVLGEISKEVTRSLDLKIVMERIDHALRKIVEYRRLSLDVVDPEQELITAIYRPSEGEVETVEGAAIPLSETIAGSAIIQGLAVIVSVEPGSAVIDRYPRIRSAVHDGVRSILAVPVVSNGRPVASLMLVANKVNAFGSAESLLLSKVAAQIGGAISNALLAADVARDSEQRQILAEIGRVVTASPSVEDTYERFAELALSLIPADRLVLAYKNDELGTIQNVFVAGTHIAGQEAGSVHVMDGGLSSLILKLRQPVCVNSNDQAKLFDSELMQSALESGLRSFLAIPMIWNGNVIGTINFRSRNPAAFHARDILIGEQIAAQISGAIVNSRMADRERRHAEEVQSLAQLGELLSRSPDLDGSLNAGAELISGLLRSDRLQVFDVQSSGDIANLLFNWAKNGRTGRTNEQKPTRGSLFEWVIANAAPVALDHETSKEILELNLTLPSLRYYRSHLLLPLFSGEQVVGLLVSSSHDPRRISTRQRQIGREVATHISNLMVNAARFRELKREADTRRLIASVSHSVSQDLELTAVVQRLAAELSHILAFDRFEVVLLDQDERAMTLVYEEGVGAGNTALGRPVKIPRDDDCWHDFADYATDPWAWGSKLIGKNGALSTLIPGQDLTGLSSLVMAPLGAPQSWVLGFIALRTVQENAYADQDLELLQLIAGQVTPAIRNAQTHEQAIRLAQIEAEAGELIRMNRLKSKFLSTVSHELRTPLTAMLAFTDILSRNRARNLTDSQLGQLDVIRKSGRRLNLLIEDLLDVSRIDMDQLNLTVYEFSWKDILRDITSSFAPILDAKHQSLNLDSLSPDIWIRADRGRIVQVVSNLLTNASKYSPDGATIRLRWKCDGESLLFDVQDDGIGIAESDQQQLFTPFFRVDNEATRSQPGTGLGLVIVKSIIELHGGKIDVSSELGRGTTFSVSFPGVLPGPSEEWLRQRDALDLEPVPHSRLDVV